MAIAPILKKVYDFFPHRKDFLWGITAGKEGEPPAGKTASRFLPWAGFAVMRSSWEKDATYLCFDAGPLGKAHMHQDKLNINIYKGSEELLFDDGGGQYDNSPHRTYALSAADHNTVLVDGEGQYRLTPKIADEPLDAHFFSDSQFDYACGIYDDTFGEDMLKPASHQREVLFVKPDFFVVADTLRSTDGKSHDYTMLLQLDTLNVKANPQKIHGILGGQYDLFAMPLTTGLKVDVDSGKDDPISGWYVARNDKSLHPASTVKITAEKQKDYRFLTLFFPLKKGAVPPTAERLNEREWKISFDGQSRILDLSDLQANFR